MSIIEFEENLQKLRADFEKDQLKREMQSRERDCELKQKNFSDIEVEENLRKFRADVERRRPELEAQTRMYEQLKQSLRTLNCIMCIIDAACEDKHLLN